jgi:hypothetical protein
MAVVEFMGDPYFPAGGTAAGEVDAAQEERAATLTAVPPGRGYDAARPVADLAAECGKASADTGASAEMENGEGG